MNNLINVELNGEHLVVSSREIANNFEKRHYDVIKTIENLTTENFAVKNLFIEDTFEHRGNTYKQYWLTRDAFSLLVMGFTGAKALEWKLKYIEAFNKMEATIKNNLVYQGMSKELQAIFTIDKKQQVIEHKVDTVTSEFNNFRDNAPLFNIECEELQKALRVKVISEMGGKKSNAYNDKPLRTKVFIDAQKQIKREFGINSYKAIKRVQFNKALELINNYQVPYVLRDLINATNKGEFLS